MRNCGAGSLAHNMLLVAAVMDMLLDAGRGSLGVATNGSFLRSSRAKTARSVRPQASSWLAAWAAGREPKLQPPSTKSRTSPTSRPLELRPSRSRRGNVLSASCCMEVKPQRPTWPMVSTPRSSPGQTLAKASQASAPPSFSPPPKAQIDGEAVLDAITFVSKLWSEHGHRRTEPGCLLGSGRAPATVNGLHSSPWLTGNGVPWQSLFPVV